MRPSDKYNHPSYNYLSSSNSFSPTTTINSTSTCFNNSSSSTYSSPSISTKLFPIFQSTKIKLKCILNKLQYALWDAMEKGLLMVAHYLATVMVLALQCYRLAKHPSFWLETSELALRCLVAETKSRPELNKLFSWLEWTGLKTPRKLFGFALDHGSEFFIHLALRPRINSFL
ncbi:hypothetical protein BJ944DRAFT_265505 [Cunninghamella echinulata]|nr:hypothetical protein BJ944DRAFT_265505 [Cunninghamella echinulata]